MDWLESADTSPNRAYPASCLRHSAQISIREASDTLGTLYAVSFEKVKSHDKTIIHNQ